jgi:RecA-family ATPase
MSLTLRSIAAALGGKISGKTAMCRCPAHDDKTPSLSVKQAAAGKLLFKCHAGCTQEEVVAALKGRGLWPEPDDKRKVVVRTFQYDYRDPATGEFRYSKERKEYDDGTKSVFFPAGVGRPGMGRNGSEPLLYGGERIADLSEGHPVIICEGEKKVHRLRELGAFAVCGDDAATSKWLPAHAALLRGLEIVLWPDSDWQGEKYVANAAQCLDGHAASLRVVRPFGLPNGSKGLDVCDWKGDADALVKLVESAVPYEAPEARPADPLPFLDMSRWTKDNAPERDWCVHERIPRRQPTLFSGEGAIGKSLVELHLACAHILARDWLGTMPESGDAVCLNAEDEGGELHRRLAVIAKHYNVEISEIVKGLHLLSLAGEDALLGVPGKGGIIEPTRLFMRLLEAVKDIKPVHLGIDTSADVYGGNENDRSQVRQFVGLLRKLAIAGNCSVVLLSHPSLTGINTGSGLSGSTGWHNSVRARMYLRGVQPSEGEQQDSDLREIEFLKNNYGPKGESVVLRYKNGLFLPVPGASSLEKIASEATADEAFLSLLWRFEREGRTVNDKEAANNYAPKMFFAEMEAAKANLTKVELKAAMLRLFASGKIFVEHYGRPSRPQSKIAIKEGSASDARD